jgi:hypothetical protein
MNEKDLEQRLRSVVEGSQPSAPPTLRRFLHELPESEKARRTGPLGWLRHVVDGLPALIPQAPVARRAQMALMVGIALIIGVAGGGFLMSLRQSAPVGSLGLQPTPEVTPRRSMPATTPAPLTFTLPLANSPTWIGVPSVGNENMAVPTSAVPGLDGGYVGVTMAPYGPSGLVYSTDGLYWDWTPAADIGAAGVELSYIASNGQDRLVLVGAAQGLDGTMDGLVYTSGDGRTWQPIPDQSLFRGTPIQVVVHGQSGFVALGWNTTGQTAALHPITEWVSEDGITWTRVPALPIKGTSALLVSTHAGYVLSGTPLATGAIDEPPFWYSTDGVTWKRAVTTDNTAQKLGSLTSVTLTSKGALFGISSINDGTEGQLVKSADGGLHWTSVEIKSGLPDPNGISCISSLGKDSNTSWLVAINSMKGSHLFVSSDGGLTWTEAWDANKPAPMGMTLLQLGSGYEAGATKVLSYGSPSDHLGTWLASASADSW